jgi:hypothetical protein
MRQQLIDPGLLPDGAFILLDLAARRMRRALAFPVWSHRRNENNMPHRQQLVVDLAVMEQRIKDGDGYLHRMRELLERMSQRGEDCSDAVKAMAELEATQQAFIERRDALEQALKDLGAPT